MKPARHAWIDASAGVAGDMLLAAFLDAGARLDVVCEAVEAVVPGAASLSAALTTRAGLRALAVRIDVIADDPPRRTWRDLRVLLATAALRETTRGKASRVFQRLAEAEARAHGIPSEEVHFHEVGAIDSIADVVGTCAAFDDLGIISASAGEVSVGSGRLSAFHGDLPIPGPAVVELARGWRIRAGWTGELATPTGLALLRTLAGTCEELPTMTVEAIGVGAGSRDPHDRANIVRVVIGEIGGLSQDLGAITEHAVLLETNVDDLDPRLWPGTIARLLEDGASDAWLVPIVMKKGRPAYTLCVLSEPEHVEKLRARMFRDTGTLGVREGHLRKTSLRRSFIAVDVPGGKVSLKIGHACGVIVQVMPEFEEVVALARRVNRPERLVLQEAMQAAADAGLRTGAALPPGQERG
ncbi:nickel pincer cofactor biosynthesis protein LarC [Lentzea sp. NPDC058450]|uniref:nickel pincer cofactor biosynthesis protein LarC n=1 Tax=Lentzea sp. NPDC058450 TaxID=3346505 RepID=UPI00365441D4